jgi:hypothetical protein
MSFSVTVVTMTSVICVTVVVAMFNTSPRPASNPNRPRTCRPVVVIAATRASAASRVNWRKTGNPEL